MQVQVKDTTFTRVPAESAGKEKLKNIFVFLCVLSV